MSLRKSPTLTPALLASNRRNARQSTGPRTARGKAQSRLNGLKEGRYSPTLGDLLESFLSAPVGAAYETARGSLTPEEAAHPCFARYLEAIRWAATGSFGDEEESKVGRRKREHARFAGAKPEGY